MKSVETAGVRRNGPRESFRRAHMFHLTDVRLGDGEFRRAMESNAAWLLSLEPDRFLAWFRKEAGLEPKAPVYEGWESTGVAGQGLGHYLSALVMQHSATGDVACRQRAEYVVDELALCQKQHGDGFVAAIPHGRRVFEEIRSGSIRVQRAAHLNDSWAPWYTIDKLLAGLHDVYVHTGYPSALDVIVNLCEYIDGITAGLDEAQWQDMMRCEFGGMNHTLADIYTLTGNPRHLALADKFYHKAILDPLVRGEDPLPGKHANTQVPKLRGLAAIYERTGREDHRKAAEHFWRLVVERHSYVNGGNSAHEHFGPQVALNDRVEATTETCNTYNMLRLTRYLFGWNPHSVYMDYYERGLLNHILASQHRASGMVGYLGYVDRPARKHFCTPDASWWCCVGTGLENHTKYGESIYACNDSELFINLFIASTLNYRAKGMRLTLRTDFPFDDAVRVDIDADRPTRIDLLLRKPAWCDALEIRLNGVQLDAVAEDSGYVRIAETFKQGDRIDIRLPMSLRTESMPDNPGRIAFFYGPVLLAAVLEDGRNMPMEHTNHMQYLRSIRARVDRIPMLLTPQDGWASVVGEIPGEPLSFVIRDRGRVLSAGELVETDITLRPAFTMGPEVYSVYLDTYSPDEWQLQIKSIEKRLQEERALSARTLAVVRIGEQQSEIDFNLAGETTRTGNHGGLNWRDAREGGWFSYTLPVDRESPCELVVTYFGTESGSRRFDILADHHVIATQELQGSRPGEFFDVVYPIPGELTHGRSRVRITFRAHKDHIAGGVYGCRLMRQVPHT